MTVPATMIYEAATRPQGASPQDAMQAARGLAAAARLGGVKPKIRHTNPCYLNHHHFLDVDTVTSGDHSPDANPNLTADHHATCGHPDP